jgi:FkbH-like protein
MDLKALLEETNEAPSWLVYRRVAAGLRALLDSSNSDLPKRIRVAFVGSFTMDPLVDFTVVEAARLGLGVVPYVAPYGQFSQEILAPASGLSTFAPDITIFMVEFNSLVSPGNASSPDDMAREALSQITSLADDFSRRHTGTLIVSTFLEIPQWPLHILLDNTTKAVREGNLLLFHALEHQSRVQISDVDGLAAYYGRREAFSSEMLHMARVPFSEGFLALLARKLVSHIKAQTGLLRKCLVLDCDNTLWGGVVGEDGIDGIALGPDWPGREYLDFQHTILSLHQQGVILAINSKNNYDDVMQVLHKHPHMVLREDHFASIQVNWDDKPSNMRRIVDEINIGLDALMFLDDSPAERALMRTVLPEIYTLELPTTASLYSQALRETNDFAKPSITEEDRLRGQAYADERKRGQLRKSAGSLEDFLHSLGTVASMRAARVSDIKRVAQLTQRTNQFTLTNRRYSEGDIASMLQDGHSHVYVLGVKDRFGDSGTVGAAIVVDENEYWRIESFVMSCRVIGRQVEDAFVKRIVDDAARIGVKQVNAEYLRSAKNGLVEDFWSRMHFESVEATDKGSQWRAVVATLPLKHPPHIRCEEEPDVEA